MDALVNFGNLLISSRSYTDRPDRIREHAGPLYTGKLGKVLPVVLTLTTLFVSSLRASRSVLTGTHSRLNATILVLGILLAFILTLHNRDDTEDTEETSTTASMVYAMCPPTTLQRVLKTYRAAFLYSCGIPLIAAASSLVEVVKLRRHTLKPVYIVVSASAATAFWIICFVLWAGCEYQDYAHIMGHHCPQGLYGSPIRHSQWRGTSSLVWVTLLLVLPTVVL